MCSVSTCSGSCCDHCSSEGTSDLHLITCFTWSLCYFISLNWLFRHLYFILGYLLFEIYLIGLLLRRACRKLVWHLDLKKGYSHFYHSFCFTLRDYLYFVIWSFTLYLWSLQIWLTFISFRCLMQHLPASDCSNLYVSMDVLTCSY